jgi:phosphate transport system permease protein
VSEATLNGTSVQAAESSSRASVLRRLRTGDLVFHGLTRAAAITVLVLLSGVILALIIGSAPALSTFGLSFITTEVWNPVTDQFGALAPIYGTLVTSIIAMLIAVPVGVLPHRALPADAAPADRHRH